MASAKKQETFDQPNKLMLKTMKLVQEAGIDDVFFKTKIPFGWLQKFSTGTFKNPSVNRVVYIYEKLTNTNLI